MTVINSTFSPRNSEYSSPCYALTERCIGEGFIYIGTHTDTDDDLYDLVYKPKTGEILRITTDTHYEVFTHTASAA